MKDLDKRELTSMLCSTGYLPPRTEEEQLFFEQMYDDYQPQLKDRHVDIDAIINGQCTISKAAVAEPAVPYQTQFGGTMGAGHMAARNFNKLPQEIIDKIKGQHKDKK